MTKEDIKKFMPLMQAMLEGKTIQHKHPYGQGWNDVDEICISDEVSSYRIKPEPKYRPFKNAEECWDEMRKHRPVGWVKCQEKKSYTIFCNVDGNCDFEADFEDFIFADGTPFGVMKRNEIKRNDSKRTR